MRKAPAKQGDQIKRLLDHGARVLGLRLCYHDRRNSSGLPKALRMHLHRGCQVVRKGKDSRRCIEFCANIVHRELETRPEGRIHVCPFGLTEIAVPVAVMNGFAGVLFAGPCWFGKGPCPSPTLPQPKKRSWLEERHTMLRAIAAQLSALLNRKEAWQRSTPTKKEQILRYISSHLNEPIRIADLAKALSLSVSRTSHLVNQLFGESLPNLVNAMKLEQSTHWLSASDLSVGEIALFLGFRDQNYFARLFARKYGIPPTEYRRTHPFEA